MSFEVVYDDCKRWALGFGIAIGSTTVGLFGTPRRNFWSRAVDYDYSYMNSWNSPVRHVLALYINNINTRTYPFCLSAFATLRTGYSMVSTANFCPIQARDCFLG
jgi:hypothetical protein